MTQNVRGDINREIEKIGNSDEYKNLSKTQRDKLDRKLRKLSSGNVAVADVSIPGIKKEFQAHSQIHSSDSVGSNVGDFSLPKLISHWKPMLMMNFQDLMTGRQRFLKILLLK